MKGTEKQIKFANDIIKEVTDEIDNLILIYKDCEDEEEGKFAKEIFALNKIKENLHKFVEEIDSAKRIIEYKKFGILFSLNKVNLMVYEYVQTGDELYLEYSKENLITSLDI